MAAHEVAILKAIMVHIRKCKHYDEFLGGLAWQRPAVQQNFTKTKFTCAIIVIIVLCGFAFAIDPNTSIVPFNKTLAAEIKPKSIGIAINTFKNKFNNTTDQIFSLFLKLSKLYYEDDTEDIHDTFDSISVMPGNTDHHSSMLEKIENSYLLNSTDVKSIRSSDNEKEIRAQIKNLYGQLEITSTILLQALNIAPQNELLKIRKKAESEKIGLQTKIVQIREGIENNIRNMEKIKSSSFSSMYSMSGRKYDTKDKALESAKKQQLLSKGQLERAKKDFETQEYLISLLDQAIDNASSADGNRSDPFIDGDPQIAADQVQIELVKNRLLQSPVFKGFEDRSGKAIDEPVWGNGKQVYAIYNVEYFSEAGLAKKGILKVLLTGRDEITKMWRCSTVFLDTEKIFEFE